MRFPLLTMLNWLLLSNQPVKRVMGVSIWKRSSELYR
jgi:hypothetical protein